MYTYCHRVQYYETDRMGITHHSNYIRFMEEARTEWMKDFGWSYQKCEELGMVGPVLAVRCQYKKTTTYDDIISIEVRMISYNSVRMTVGYRMTAGEKLVAVGETEHCFLNDRGVPVRLKREHPEFDAILRAQLELDTQE